MIHNKKYQQKQKIHYKTQFLTQKIFQAATLTLYSFISLCFSLKNPHKKKTLRNFCLTAITIDRNSMVHQ